MLIKLLILPCVFFVSVFFFEFKNCSKSFVLSVKSVRSGTFSTVLRKLRKTTKKITLSVALVKQNVCQLFFC